MNKRFFSLFIVFAAYFSCAWTFLPGGGYKIKTIVIDAGHGGKDPGNLGTGRHKVSEKHIALDVALKLGELIKAEFPEIKVIYTRDKDVFIGLDERAKIANDANADLFISIHCNAAKNLGANGAETFVLGLHKTEENLLIAQQENSVIFMEDDYETKYEGFDPNSAESIIAMTMMQSAFLNQSIELSAHVQDEFVRTAHREDRGVKQAGFLVLRKTTMPAILIELGFLTNKEDEDFLVSVNGKTKMAASIYDALKKYKAKHEIAETGVSSSETVKEKTPEQLKAEADKKAKENADLKAKQEAEAKIKSEKKTKEDAALKAKQDAEAKEKAFAEMTAKLQADKKAKEDAALKAAQETEAKAKELEDKKTKEAEELKAKESEERIAKLKAIKEQDEKEQAAKAEEEKQNLEKAKLLAEFEARLKEKEELEAIKKAQEESLQKAKEMADQNAKMEAEARAKIEGDLKEKKDTEIKAMAEADRKAKEQADLKAKQEAEAKAKTEAEQRLKVEAAAKAKAEADRKANEQAELKAKQNAEAKAKAEAEQKLKDEAAAKAKTEADRKANEQAELKAKQDAEAKAKAEAEQKLRYEAAAKEKAENDQKTKEQIEIEEKAKQEAIARKKSDEVAELEREVMLAKKEELLRKIRETLESPTVRPEEKTEAIKKEEPKKTVVKEQVQTQKEKTDTQPEIKQKAAAATGKLVFRVQFFSSPTSFPLSSPKFSGIEDVFEYQGGGLFKYASGNFDSVEAATAQQVKVRKKGFTDAFVVAFLNGERIDMAKARAILNK